jgi:Flp pilus assembly pilin Flp
MISNIVGFVSEERGATPFEYGVISAIVSVVAIHGLYLLMRGS